MWLSQNLKFGGDNSYRTAEVGNISIGGSSLAVVTQSEQRNLKMALQSGYYWCPNVGDKVLVITSEDGEPIVIGAIPTTTPSLSSGELLISGNGASVRLSTSGNITLTGSRISIDGSLVINGTAYIPYTGGEL